MTAYTQSGYPVVTSYGDPQLVSNPVIPGTNVKVLGGLRAGAVATVLLYVLARFDKEVEDLDEGMDDWGYDLREIRGGSGWSNHAGGCAADANASRHPQHVRGTFAASQVAAIRRILADCDGVVEWGGDWGDGDVDEMHFQIRNNFAGTGRVEALAAKINGSGGGSAGPIPTPKPPAHPAPTPPSGGRPTAFPLPRGYYFGPYEGPTESISGSGVNDAKWRPYVKRIQARLKFRGYDIGAVDGIVGPKFIAAVKLCQSRAPKALRLAVDGLVGASTWAYIKP